MSGRVGFFAPFLLSEKSKEAQFRETRTPTQSERGGERGGEEGERFMEEMIIIIIITTGEK